MKAPIVSQRRVRRTPWLGYLVAGGVALHTFNLVRRNRVGGAAVAVQDQIRRDLLARFAQTAFGRSEGIRAEMSGAEFRMTVAVRSYEELAPWIERMQRGEADVLWPGRCAYYAVSSGTTAGRTKYLPITPEMLAHFRRAGLASLCYYNGRRGHARVFRGRHLFLGGATRLAPIEHGQPFRAWGGDLSGITAVNLPRWIERQLYEPGREVARIADWPTKLRAIAERTQDRDITLVGGIPSWLLILAEQMRATTGAAVMSEIWPRLECLVHGGVPLGPFAGELRAAFGEGINFHEVYPASEGFIAAQDASPEDGLRLIADAGIFYEFVPWKIFQNMKSSEVGAHAVTLEGVLCGVDYVLLMTTPGGLCRYVIGDVVRFISKEPPRLVYVGRTSLQLSAFGEHVIEKELTDALTVVAARHAFTVINFHVAPVFARALPPASRGRHEWWLEVRTGGESEVDQGEVARALDTELQRLNEDYEAKRQGGGLELPLVRWVRPGTFEQWMRAKGKWGGQSKMPRCRSDREIADDLDRWAR